MKKKDLKDQTSQPKNQPQAAGSELKTVFHYIVAFVLKNSNNKSNNKMQQQQQQQKR